MLRLGLLVSRPVQHVLYRLQRLAHLHTPETNVSSLVNDALSTFYLWLHGYGPFRKKGNVFISQRRTQYILFMAIWLWTVQEQRNVVFISERHTQYIFQTDIL